MRKPTAWLHNRTCNLRRRRRIVIRRRQGDLRSVKDTSDSELMRQVRGGRTAALATLFERHHARLYRYSLRMTGNRAAAEDLVQDVFMKMLKYKTTFKDDSEFVPWMFGIGRNACLAHLRKTADDRFADGDVD